mmetsp:Transcript_2784/g.4876  ORF Transcript_2784/g.4876 Transcript_2784/m.4876 type:complete len:211 (-) Transcript_2784:23-655(-)
MIIALRIGPIPPNSSLKSSIVTAGARFETVILVPFDLGPAAFGLALFSSLRISLAPCRSTSIPPLLATPALFFFFMDGLSLIATPIFLSAGVTDAVAPGLPSSDIFFPPPRPLPPRRRFPPWPGVPPGVPTFAAPGAVPAGVAVAAPVFFLTLARRAALRDGFSADLLRASFTRSSSGRSIFIFYVFWLGPCPIGQIINSLTTPKCITCF